MTAPNFAARSEVILTIGFDRPSRRDKATFWLAQAVAEAEELLAEPLLTREQSAFVRGKHTLARRALKRAEKLLRSDRAATNRANHREVQAGN
jgi:hypothetical protein